MMHKFLSALALAAALPSPHAYAQTAPDNAPSAQDPLFATLDADFAQWMKDNHVPGMVWGVVKDGALVHLGALGLQKLDGSTQPVTGDTGFRIASMSKAFTGYAILQLRDAGKLRLDDPAWKYIPEIKRWAGDIRVADLLHHSAGFVTDDPWGDRQQVMPEAAFTQLLKAGVPRTAEPGTRYEYSNMGYAMLGRIITNVSGKDFAGYIRSSVFQPLGMAATTYEFADVPTARQALGYRWENDGWRAEPYMKHGAFGAMGGITTSGRDYAKWVGFLLSGWPAHAADSKAKTTLRAMQYGGGLPHRRTRPGKEGANCRITGIYAAGLVSSNDCLLGPVLFHGGGFPGYGSHMLLIPDAGLGVFALSNRTYAGPSAPVWDAATLLMQNGFASPRPLPVSSALAEGYAAVAAIWQEGSIVARKDGLAMNMLLDRSAENWSVLLKGMKEKTGLCDTSAPITATGNLSGRFSWKCATGRITGTVLLAPSEKTEIQSLNIEAIN